MAFFSKPQKGKRCKPLADGSGFDCERTERDSKTGERFAIGNTKIKLNPSTCKPRFEEIDMLDEDMGAVDDIVDMMARGCGKK